MGRILAGLPVLSSRFAVSEPNFWTLNPLDHDARAKQVEIDAKVSAVLQSLFGDPFETSNSNSISISWSCLCSTPQNFLE